MAKRKFSAKQLAAQRAFAARARAGTLRKGSRIKRVAKAKRTGRRKSSVAKPKSRARRVASRINARLNLKRNAIRAGAGALATYAPTVAGDYGAGLALGAVGVATGDDALQAMGAVSLGAAATRQLTRGTLAAPSGSVRFI